MSQPPSFDKARWITTGIRPADRWITTGIRPADSGTSRRPEYIPTGGSCSEECDAIAGSQPTGASTTYSTSLTTSAIGRTSRCTDGTSHSDTEGT